MQTDMFKGSTMEYESQDITAAYSHNDKYSSEANRSIVKDKKRIRTMVIEYIKQQPKGATSDEVEVGLQMSHQCISARITELKALGQLVLTGEKRKTRSGRNAGVLRYEQL